MRRLSSAWLRRVHRSSQNAPTAIEKIMADTVKATGPISFATYMQLCLSHPVHGYYMSQSNPVFGSRGDFVTSPEISQAFGEVLALWMIGRWSSAGSKPFRIVELGPGRGTLMGDVLRVVRQLPSVRPHLDSVHLVETSPAMRALQHSTLRPAHEDGRVPLSWHNALDEVPRRDDHFTMLVAHEFFDALPVHVIEKTVQGWHEVLITPTDDPSIRYARPSSTVLDPSSTPAPPPPLLQPRSPRWTRVLSPTPTASSTLLGHASPRFAALPVGARVEVSGASVKIARQIAELLAPRSNSKREGRGGGGCALVIDYGVEKAVGDSLRAFKQHDIVDVFHRPGECDVTANVDFALLKEVLSDLVTPHGTLSQGTFLNEVGIQLRAERLIQAASTEERKTAIAESVNRLVDPLSMGGQYSVLGITTTPKDGAVWPFLHTPSSSH